MLAWEASLCCRFVSGSNRTCSCPGPRFTDEQLHDILWDTIQKLYDRRIVLDFTDHLSDRQLYCLIFRDILPSPRRSLKASDNFLHWDCADAGGDPEVWLRYYASEEDRRSWIESGDGPLPPTEPPPIRVICPVARFSRFAPRPSGG